MQTHFMDINQGRVVCEAHAGRYLTQALEADPDLMQVVTPLDTWVRMGEADVADHAAFLKGLYGHEVPVCETCYEAKMRSRQVFTPAPNADELDVEVRD